MEHNRNIGDPFATAKLREKNGGDGFPPLGAATQNEVFARAGAGGGTTFTFSKWRLEIMGRLNRSGRGYSADNPSRKVDDLFFTAGLNALTANTTPQTPGFRP